MREDYPFYHHLHVPHVKQRSMKEVKSDYNKYLKKFEVAETKRWKR